MARYVVIVVSFALGIGLVSVSPIQAMAMRPPATLSAPFPSSYRRRRRGLDANMVAPADQNEGAAPKKEVARPPC